MVNLISSEISDGIQGFTDESLHWILLSLCEFCEVEQSGVWCKIEIS